MWMVMGLVYVLLERGLLGDSELYPSTGNPYDFKGAILSIFPSTLMMGLIFGVVEIYFINRFFVKKSFGEKIIYKAAIYLLSLITFLSIMTLFSNAYQLGLPITHPEVYDKLVVFFTSISFWSVILYASIGTIFMLFISEVSNNLGPNVLLNFLIGKYHKPRVEERIFMFLDMKSSTTIAEKLGHVQYFNFLNEYYADITDPIINSFGKIYQYVGDEVIVTWESKEDQIVNHAILCFYNIKKQIESNADKYLKKYGLVPDFKAGIHGGQVSTGEIGTVKKDIVFSGDVLNTTARIQSLCNEHSSEMLISEWIKSKMNLPPSIKSKEIGKIQLRGKNEQVKIYSIIRE